MTGDVDARELAKTESALAGYEGEDRVVSSQDFWHIHENISSIEQKMRFGGMPKLNGYMDGLETGEVIVVSGPTKQGKTTLCDTIGRNLAKLGVNCLWFSFEVQQRRFLAKYKMSDVLVYVPLQLHSGDTIWLEKKVHEAKLKYNCRVVFIDHLHFIVDMARTRNPSIEIGSVMRFLKQRIAIKHNVAVVLIAHLTKTKLEEEPTENDLRDSSFIAQEADATLMIYRRLNAEKGVMEEDAYSTKARVIVCNHRRTGVMKGRVDMVKVGDDLVEEETWAQAPPAKNDTW